MITYNTDNMIAQRFAFRASIMNYVFKNVQPHHLLKLYRTCKYFYAKYRLNIIQHLVIVSADEPEIFDPVKTIIRISNPALSKLADFWITDSFVLRSRQYAIPSFAQCTIKKLELTKFILWEEFQMLTAAGTIEDLKIKGVYCDDDFADIDIIIAQVPNATSIEISESKVSATTGKSLADLNHKTKLTNVVLTNLTQYFYTSDFRNFFLKNADYDCHVRLAFPLIPEYNDADRQYNNELIHFGNTYSQLITIALDLKKTKDAFEKRQELKLRES